MVGTYVPDIHLKGLVGSHAYGLATPASDMDYLGVFSVPSTRFMGIQPHEEDSQVTKNPDTQLHELGKACRLLLACNPTVTEILWLDDYTICDGIGQELIDQRKKFLSEKLVRNAYFGYATAQFKRLKERGDNFGADIPKRRVPKHARHMLRLLSQGFDLWYTGNLPIRVEDADTFFTFGNVVAEQAEEGVYQAAESALSYYEDLFATSTSALATDPLTAQVENWLIEKRLDALGVG